MGQGHIDVGRTKQSDDPLGHCIQTHVCLAYSLSDLHHVFDNIVDLFFLIDMILMFFTTYIDSHGQDVVKKEATHNRLPSNMLNL